MSVSSRSTDVVDAGAAVWPPTPLTGRSRGRRPAAAGDDDIADTVASPSFWPCRVAFVVTVVVAVAVIKSFVVRVVVLWVVIVFFFLILFYGDVGDCRLGW